MNEEVTGASKETVSFDRESLARLGRIALQGRRISDVLEKTKLSRSTVSKLLNKSMKNRPSIDTLRKLAGENHPALFRQMLEACGYPPDIQEDLNAFRSFVDETPACLDTAPGQAKWSVSRALAIVLDSLKDKGYGNRFEIDYRAEGVFAVDLGEQYPVLICVPVVLADSEMNSRNAMNLALEGIARGITQWGLEDTATLILTDSPSVFRLLKQLPNLSQGMAVALVSGDGCGFGQQYTILPFNPLADQSGEFPVDLSMPGKQPVQN